MTSGKGAYKPGQKGSEVKDFEFSIQAREDQGMGAADSRQALAVTADAIATRRLQAGARHGHSCVLTSQDRIDLLGFAYHRMTTNTELHCVF